MSVSGLGGCWCWVITPPHHSTDGGEQFCCRLNQAITGLDCIPAPGLQDVRVGRLTHGVRGLGRLPCRFGQAGGDDAEPGQRVGHRSAGDVAGLSRLLHRVSVGPGQASVLQHEHRGPVIGQRLDQCSHRVQRGGPMGFPPDLPTLDSRHSGLNTTGQQTAGQSAQNGDHV
jgi:hypothetical protein